MSRNLTASAGLRFQELKRVKGDKYSDPRVSYKQPRNPIALQAYDPLTVTWHTYLTGAFTILASFIWTAICLTPLFCILLFVPSTTLGFGEKPPANLDIRKLIVAGGRC